MKGNENTFKLVQSIAPVYEKIIILTSSLIKTEVIIVFKSRELGYWAFLPTEVQTLYLIY